MVLPAVQLLVCQIDQLRNAILKQFLRRKLQFVLNLEFSLKTFIIFFKILLIEVSIKSQILLTIDQLKNVVLWADF